MGARWAAKASLALPMCLLAVTSGLADYYLLLQSGPTELVQARIEATPTGMTPFSVLFFLALTFAAPILLPLGVWIVAEMMNGYLYLILDLRVARLHVRRVVAYGFLPLAIERLLTVVFLFVGLPESNPFNPLASNPAFLFDPASTSIFLYEFVRGFDAFSVWALVIVASGLAAVGEERLRYVLPPLVLAWLVWILTKAWALS